MKVIKKLNEAHAAMILINPDKIDISKIPTNFIESHSFQDLEFEETRPEYSGTRAKSL
jgi:hypothetical protein